MITRISSISCSHAPAIPSDEGRIYSRIGQVLRPCMGIASVKDTYSAFVKDRFENFRDRQQVDPRTRPPLTMNHWLANLAFHLAAALESQQNADPTRIGTAARDPRHLIIIRA